MHRKRIELTVSLRQAVVLLLLLGGSLLWAFPAPDTLRECEQICMQDFKSSVVAEYNAMADRGVQELSELDDSQIHHVASRLRETHGAEFRRIIERVYIACLVHLVAAGSWLAATLTLLVLIRGARQESLRHYVADREAQPKASLKPTSRAAPVGV